MDVFSRRIVGWAMATHLRTELVLEALNLATVAAPPSWRDSSFGPGQSVHLNRVRPAVRTSRRAALDGFGGRLREIASTMPCARVSSLHSKCELLDRRHFKTQIEARMAIFEFIEGCYNPHRRHSALDYHSPIN